MGIPIPRLAGKTAIPKYEPAELEKMGIPYIPSLNSRATHVRETKHYVTKCTRMHYFEPMMSSDISS